MHAVDLAILKHFPKRIEGERDIPGFCKGLCPAKIGITGSGEFCASGCANRTDMEVRDVAGSDDPNA
ncbi:hypothetical protein NB311A_09526 [Nitrobacter sp. Nb-311A]|nr:hypothetical protein NB311A_09526 [Nitrobacter sp. Nb-311A]